MVFIYVVMYLIFIYAAGLHSTQFAVLFLNWFASLHYVGLLIGHSFGADHENFSSPNATQVQVVCSSGCFNFTRLKSVLQERLPGESFALHVYIYQSELDMGFRSGVDSEADSPHVALPFLLFAFAPRDVVLQDRI